MPAPAPHADALIRRLETEVEERSALIQGLAQDAQAAGRDLSDSELEQIERAESRIADLGKQLGPLRTAAKTTIESRSRMQEVSQELEALRRSAPGRGLPSGVDYSSAGAYVADLYHAHMGDREAADRVESFHRAAAHQTTSDNAGLLPQRIVEPVITVVDQARPVISSIGATDLGQGSWSYARVTQHTQVGVQSAEKAELPSRKMTVGLTAITAATYGGYVNVSKQNIRRTSPQILDMVINDLAGQYAIETEDDCCDDLVAGGTAGTVEIPATPTLIGISQAIWGAVGQSAGLLRAANIPATRPALFASADMMGLLGPFFPGVNPQNQISTGLDMASLGQPNGGFAGSLGPLDLVWSPAFAAGTLLFAFRSGLRCYEDRYGSMQVDEPSVWGTQVGYAGDFETVILNAGAVIVIDQAEA